MIINLNNYISKRHQNMVAKFNQDLEAFAKETDEAEATLYEDAYTDFTLSNVRLEDGNICYCYDGKEYSDPIVLFDEEDGEYYEDEGIDGIVETIKYWRSCLRRAKRYWGMSGDTLEMIQDGIKEDID